MAEYTEYDIFFEKISYSVVGVVCLWKSPKHLNFVLFKLSL